MIDNGSGQPTPKFKAAVFVNAARKGEDGASCQGTLTIKGSAQAGPDSSRTRVTWKFIEHRDGFDYYTFDWTLTNADHTENRKSTTIAFDGETKINVIDEEHHIFVQKGPLMSQLE